MNIYDYDAIKAAGDCVDYCQRVLGLAPQGKSGEWVKFNNPWRPGSDSGAFSVSAKGYHDHVSDESGSILDLCANARHGGDMWAAQEELGQMLGLKPKLAAKQKRRFVCAYDYVDAAGALVFQVVRWEPKAFSQRRPDPAKAGEWIWNLDGIKPVLYRLPEWSSSRWLCIVGGEKDADNLWKLGIQATTNHGGEGHWLPEYASSLAGKHVCIIPDKDEVGRRHAEAVQYSIKDTAAAIKVLDLPGDGKDVSDWIAAGGTRGALLQLMRDCPTLDAGTIEQPKATGKQISAAKRANERPFANYNVMVGVDENGKERKLKEPRKIMDMVNDLFARFWDFPRRIGSALFDHDRQTGRIRFIDSSPALIAWIAEKSGHKVEWAKQIEGAVTYEQFYHAVLANARYYDMISGVPSWPTRDDVYYTHGQLPAADPQARRFNELCGFFNPADETDKLLLRVLFASPLYYRPRVDRPAWIIDSIHGQGSGKTKLIEMLAYLYGGDGREEGDPLYIDYNQLNNETQVDRIVRRLLSQNGRRKRIMLLDNVEGYFRSPALACMVTQSSISGMAPYGRGEETRQMDLTICLTSNSATMDRDLISRAFIVHLAMPEQHQRDWERVVTAYIHEHRLQIIADIIGILERGPKFDAQPVTRFKTWEHEIMLPMFDSMEEYNRVCKENSTRQHDDDATVEEADILRQHFTAKLMALGVNPAPEYQPVWITSRVVSAWANEAIEGFGGKGGRAAMQKIKNMVKTGLISDIGTSLKLYPHRGPLRGRGVMWNPHAYFDGKEANVIYIDTDGATRVCRDNE